MSHTLIAVAVVGGVGWLGEPWIGAVLIIAFFAGREHAQAEYRWVQEFGAGKRTNMPLWAGFDPRAWDSASFLIDLVLPGVAAVLAACIPWALVRL